MNKVTFKIAYWCKTEIAQKSRVDFCYIGYIYEPQPGDTDFFYHENDKETIYIIEHGHKYSRKNCFFISKDQCLKGFFEENCYNF